MSNLGGMARISAVGLNETLTVGGMQQSLIGLSRIQRVGIKDSLKVGNTLSIEAGSTIELVCGASKIVLTPDAIHLDSPVIHILGGSSVNIDGGTVNINCGAASGASPEGPDAPDTASLLSVASPVMAAGLAMFNEKKGGGDDSSAPESSAAASDGGGEGGEGGSASADASASGDSADLPALAAATEQLEAAEGATRKERYELRQELLSASADIPELASARERLEFNNDNILRAEAAQYVYQVDEVNRYNLENQFKDGFVPKAIPAHPDLTVRAPDSLGLSQDDFTKLESGFGAVVLESSVSGETMLTFRGTTSGVDWKNNVQQGMGRESEQYTQAMDLADLVNEATSGGFVNVGHSLGGGLASAAVGVTEVPGYTFNSAGLHPKTISRREDSLSFEETGALIQSQAVKGDVLTLAQSRGVKALVTGLAAKVVGPVGAFITGMGFAGLNWLPKASGSLSTLPSIEGGSPLARHGMDQVIQGIEAQKQEDIQTISNHAKGLL